MNIILWYAVILPFHNFNLTFGSTVGSLLFPIEQAGRQDFIMKDIKNRKTIRGTRYNIVFIVGPGPGADVN